MACTDLQEVTSCANTQFLSDLGATYLPLEQWCAGSNPIKIDNFFHNDKFSGDIFKEGH